MRLFPQTRSWGHVSTLQQESNSSWVRLINESCTRKRRESCWLKRTITISLYSLENLYISQQDSLMLYVPVPILCRLERKLLLSVTIHVSLRNQLIWRRRKRIAALYLYEIHLSLSSFSKEIHLSLSASHNCSNNPLWSPAVITRKSNQAFKFILKRNESYFEVIAKYWQKKKDIPVLQYLSLHLRLNEFKLLESQWFDRGDIEQPHCCYFVTLRPYFR